MSLNESIVEDAALEWFLLREGYGGQVGDPPAPPPSPRLWRSGRLRRAKPPLAPGEPAAERDSFSDVVQFCFAQTLTPALSHGESEKRNAIRRLKPGLNASWNSSRVETFI